MKRYVWLALVPILISAYPVELTIGGRAGGMGGAFTGISDDALSLYYNPGGISFISGGEMTAMRSQYSLVSGLTFNWISVASKVNEKLGIGFGWLNKSAVLEENGYNSIDTTRMGDNLFTLGIGMRLNENIGMGININRMILSSNIGAGSGFGMDLGILSKWPKYPLYFGIVMKNLSSGMGEETYPTIYRIGMGYKALPKIVIKTISKKVKGKIKRYRVREREGYRLALDFDIETNPWVVSGNDSLGYKEGILHYYMGMEYSPLDIFGVRFGWNNLEGLAGGLRLGWQKYLIDFSYAQGPKDKELGIPIMGNIWKLAFTVEF